MDNNESMRAGPEEKSLAITVHYSNQCGNAQNCLYPYSRTSGDPEELKTLFSHDHTFIDFKDNYRCTDNFMQASVAVFDNDGDHSDDPKDWVDISDIPRLFPGVPCIISTSRHHMKQKGNKSSRPRFHVMFQINAIQSPTEYTAFLSRVQKLFPFFDKKALDAARFYFGNPDTEVYAFPGYRALDEFIAELEESLVMEAPEPWQAQMPVSSNWSSIPEGGRNNTISHAAGKILKRWGDTPEAYEHFMETVAKCIPPLPDFEVHSTWKSAVHFFHEKVEKQPGYIPAAEYNKPAEPKWEPPIPFTQHTFPVFPVNAFPPAIRDYVLAVAETTQTPVDMAATATLAVLALCQQGKYQIKGKDDWIEPLNLFTVIVAEPSERKSAVISHMIGAVHRYEAEYNKQHSGAVERNRMEKRILEKKQRNLEEMVIKGKAQMEELQEVTTQLADFREVAPLRLYVDDVTTEKLTSVLAENDGTAAVVSAEGGIFDMLAGIYTKNVNIDVFLKAHSGDDIRVDRIGRSSESIFHPALTVLLAVQPSVLSGMMSNGVFRGRGLTARFLYCMPHSRVGNRKYRTHPIPDEVARRYEVVIQNLLQEETPKTPEIIQLSPEADDGVGIRVCDRIVGIDLDHCIVDGKLLPWAREIVDRFHATYIEVSPSGTGIRIFCLLPNGFIYNAKTYYIKRGNIEVYIPGHTNRFLTITGNALTDTDVVETADALAWLLDTYMRRPTPPTPTIAVPGESYLSDDTVIAKASVAHNGEKFRRLWDGDITGYKSRSEADAALLSILAFWCSGDTAQMDRLFRQSGSMREKWDSFRGADTYGNISMQKAVTRMTDFYKPIVPRSAADDFGAERLRELDPMDSSRYPWNDIGAGHIFADFYQDRLRYVPERKLWFHYEGGIWKPDTGSLRAMKYCMELADLMYTFALEIRDEDKRKSYMKYAGRWQSHTNRVNILKDAQVYHPIPYGSFDADIYCFNCKNGTLHIDTGEFTEHRSTDLLTKISPVVYDPTAYSERFDSYIQEIMSGDMEKARFLQKIFGYGLTGDTRHECMTILYGVTTRNGKGTLCESVLKVLGDYGCASRPESIAMKSYANSSQPSEDVARLAGVRFVNIPEPGKGMVLDAAKVKAMTGNDTLNARFLHENSFDFRPQFKIYVNTNFLPVINDMTLFSSDRIIIIPFDRHFDEQSRDTTLKRRFAEEKVQSAILNWLLEGYRLLQSEGLQLPKSVKDATDRYQHDSDKLALFFEDNLVTDDTAEELTSTVYARYKGWCQENGCHPESMKNFRQGLQSFARVVRKRPKHGGEKTTLLLGYRLISEFEVPLLK